MFSRIAVALGLPFATVVALLLLQPWWQPLSNASFDLYQRVSPYELRETSVRIVDIDDSSLARIGRRPWSTDVLADLLDKLHQAGAAVVGLDLRFAERSDVLPDADRRFTEAVGQIPVVLGFDPAGAGQGRGMVLAKAPVGFVGPAAKTTRGLYHFPEAIADRAPLQAAAAGIGFAYVVPEQDGTLRRAPVIASFNNRVMPSFAAEMVRVSQNAPVYVCNADSSGMTRLLIGKRVIATDESGVVWLRYAPPRPDRFIHAADVLSGNFNPADLAHRIVLVGVTAPSLGDRWKTPIADSMPGVEILAQLVGQMFAGELPIRPAWVRGAEIISAVLAGIVLMLAAHLGRAALAGTGAALIASSMAISWYGFVHWQLVIDPVLPAATVILVAAFAVISLGRARLRLLASG
jgi:adenylate cyclase